MAGRRNLSPDVAAGLMEGVPACGLNEFCGSYQRPKGAVKRNKSVHGARRERNKSAVRLS